MKKITKPLLPDEKKFVFTEGINYFEMNKKSIWGTGDKFTLGILRKMEIHGKWLNLAAGDGRYNSILLRKVNSVVASDIDKCALSKLWNNTPEKLRTKLSTEIFNIIKKFPFDNNSFDGVFCTGTLHLFPTPMFKKIIAEIDRVLKPNGRAIIDFAADVRRISAEGKLITFGDEPCYKLGEAKVLLKDIFRKYNIQVRTSEVPEEDFTNSNPPYKFSCKLILLVADKRYSETGKYMEKLRFSCTG